MYKFETLMRNDQMRQVDGCVASKIQRVLGEYVWNRPLKHVQLFIKNRG